MPAAVSINVKGRRYNWQYETEPQAALGGRRIAQPRGRVLGGSSSVNGMIFIRGHAFDYDRWEREGASGWAYADVLPYFKRLEDYRGRPSIYRGTTGPVPVTRAPSSHPLHEAFLLAGQQAGHPYSRDLNGYQQSGVGYFDRNILNGERWSAARAYLGSRAAHDKLTIVPRALATRVVLDSGRASAVEYLCGGQRQRVECTREVIVCAGTFESPKLLMLSGIGPAQELRRHGLGVHVDLPAVGENLQDHVEVHVQYRCLKPITLYRDMAIHRRALIGLQWFVGRSGEGATNHFDTGAFLSTHAGVAHPDVQLHFVPIVYNNNRDRRVTCHGFRVPAGPIRSQSRGTVSLASANPLDYPLIQPRYMSDAADWSEMRSTIRLAREIFAQPAFDEFRGAELSPGVELTSDAALDAYIRDGADTGYHPAGTCRMGHADDSVVDELGRVHGVTGLRVIDASIMPSIISGNLNAAVIMMAEKIADSVLGHPPLPPQRAPIYETDRRREADTGAKSGGPVNRA
jgi:choline dehydrogenase